MSWFVLYIKPKNEKKAATHLKDLGINVYCPVVTQMRQWSDRKKKVEVPLISSYIFVQIEDKNRNDVFQVPGVMRYLFWLGKPAIVTDDEIGVLKAYLSNNQMVDAQIENIKPGDKLCIKKGHFRGKEGLVKEVSKNRVQLVLCELGLKITLTKQMAD